MLVTTITSLYDLVTIWLFPVTWVSTKLNYYNWHICLLCSVHVHKNALTIDFRLNDIPLSGNTSWCVFMTFSVLHYVTTNININYICGNITSSY